MSPDSNLIIEHFLNMWLNEIVEITTSYYEFSYTFRLLFVHSRSLYSSAIFQFYCCFVYFFSVKCVFAFKNAVIWDKTYLEFPFSAHMKYEILKVYMHTAHRFTTHFVCKNTENRFGAHIAMEKFYFLQNEIVFLEFISSEKKIHYEWNRKKLFP